MLGFDAFFFLPLVSLWTSLIIICIDIQSLKTKRRTVDSTAKPGSKQNSQYRLVTDGIKTEKPTVVLRESSFVLGNKFQVLLL